VRLPFTSETAVASASRLFCYNKNMFTHRRILSRVGYELHLGTPEKDDFVGLWHSDDKGLKSAQDRNARSLYIQEPFLNSIPATHAQVPALGLLLDKSGFPFDPRHPSGLEQLLATSPLDDSQMMREARNAIGRLQDLHLSQHSTFSPDVPAPDPGYVLVVDQPLSDASVTTSVPITGGEAARFREMLVFAQEEHPGARIIITPAQNQTGNTTGYFSASDAQGRVSMLDQQISPWHLLDGAIAVYTISSQLGFEAILAGHRPRVFGQPFYAGWGLTQDESPVARRQRKLTRAQLFAASMMIYPQWYDPFRDELCTLDRAIDILEAQVRAWRQDRAGWAASGMRKWKRKPLQSFFGAYQPVSFTESPTKAKASGKNWMIWAGKATKETKGAHRVEDGFIRSKGLGAELNPPMSLVVDRQGIYYDPTQTSDLEDYIHARAEMTADQTQRAERLVRQLLHHSVSKYNLGGDLPPLPEGHRILVPGQVEDDASIRKGAGKTRSNLDLLRRVRAENPDAVVIYKPHPDVEAGLRSGALTLPEDLADVIAHRADPMALLDQVQEVWTMTSLLGFEALLRGAKVTTLGAPFYAGWGLTTDLAQVPTTRRARPGLLGLAHAALIDYPRYFDPKTGLPCPVEVVVERLISGDIEPPSLRLQGLSKLQGMFAAYAHLWRR